MSQNQTKISLGKTDIQIPLIGTGAWSWGDRSLWAYGHGYGEEDIKSAFETSLESGVNFFDTAEIYGIGRSERFLGKFLADTNEPVIVATKFMPYPWRWTKGSLQRALKGSLKRLNLESVHLYQVHWPFPPVSVETWADALADAVESGLTHAVGVSNYDKDQMLRTYEVLDKRGLKLASNQVEYNLIKRDIELNGLLETCQELGITLISYSPLSQGVLTGKYSPDRPLPGIRGRRYNRSLLEKAHPLLREMRKIGRAHEDKTESQVAINWLVCKGTVPIPGAKNASQAEENCGAFGWNLSEEEVNALDEASERMM